MRLISILLLAVMISSCEQVVDMKMPDYKPVLVVNSIFEADSAASVRVIYSRSILDTASLKSIITAKVELYENEVLLGQMIPGMDKSYTLPGFTAKEGRKYQLKVSQTTFGDVTALTECPLTVSVLSTSTTLGAGKDHNNEMLAKATVTFRDPAEENYYFMTINEDRRDTIPLDSVNYIVYESSSPVYLTNIGGGDEEHFVNGGYLISDEFFNGKDQTVSLYFGEYLMRDSSNQLTLNFQTLSEDYFKYLKTYNLQQMTSGNPFAEPARVYSNISNGLGIFGGTTVRKFTLK